MMYPNPIAEIEFVRKDMLPTVGLKLSVLNLPFFLFSYGQTDANRIRAMVRADQVLRKCDAIGWVEEITGMDEHGQIEGGVMVFFDEDQQRDAIVAAMGELMDVAEFEFDQRHALVRLPGELDIGDLDLSSAISPGDYENFFCSITIHSCLPLEVKGWTHIGKLYYEFV